MNYIPLSSKKMKIKSKHTVTSLKSNSSRTASNRHGYIGDVQLLPRIQEYLDSNKEKKCVDLDELTNHLQQMFRSYARKKRGAFKGAVAKALHRLKKAEEDKEQVPAKADEAISIESSDDDYNEDAHKHDANAERGSDQNLANKGMMGLYRHSPTNIGNPVSGRSRFLGPLKKSDRPITDSGDSDDDEDLDLPKKIRFDEDLVRKIMQRKYPPPEVIGGQPPMITGSVAPEELSINPKDESISLTRKKRSVSTISLGKSSKETKKSEIQLQQSSITFADIGGYEKVLVETCKLLFHMKHPEVYERLGVKPPRGFLLHGPPGCGKTLLAHAIAGELALPFIKVAATEIVSGVSGESEEKIRDLFDKAVSSAPCILFIDEIDAITPKRETAQREMERRIVAQLLTCMDDLNMKSANTQVLVIGATNRADSLDPALRRAGRFDHEISMGIPDEAARARILSILCRDLRLEPDFDFKPLARNTPGYVGADLMGLTREAAMNAINRVFGSLQEKAAASCKEKATTETEKRTDCSELTTVKKLLEDKTVLTSEQLDSLYIQKEDFEYAIKVVQPSSKREGFATIPGVTWDDIGALKSIRQELQLSILAPIHYPEQFQALGLTSPAGILLCGPPGCGKTMLAKAIANETGVNFISVKGPELLNMYVGESERAVRQCFQRAQTSSPCVIFFDEIDALCPKRSDSSEHGSSARVVNQLLTEMDGLDARKYVFLIGATNRPDILDPAVLRPGRLDKIMYVGFPVAADRVDILRTITKNGTRPPCASDVDFHSIGYDARCHGFTGADLAALVREATLAALKESLQYDARRVESTIRLTKPPGPKPEKIQVTKQHFQAALSKIKPSVSLQSQMEYSKMQLNLNTHVPTSGRIDSCC